MLIFSSNTHKCAVIFRKNRLSSFARIYTPKFQKLIAAENDALFLKTVLKGFEGIADHQGKPLKCTDKTLDDLSQIGYFTHAVVDAYLNFIRGIAVKN